MNAALLSEINFGACEEIWIDGPQTRLQGWIMTPPDFDSGERYPAILEIHGGPMLQYGFSFVFEFHWLAAHGYVVFFTNPADRRATDRPLSTPTTTILVDAPMRI